MATNLLGEKEIVCKWLASISLPFSSSRWAATDYVLCINDIVMKNN